MSTQVYNINRFDLQECVDFTWRVSDCEELVRGFTGDDVGSHPVKKNPQSISKIILSKKSSDIVPKFKLVSAEMRLTTLCIDA